MKAEHKINTERTRAPLSEIFAALTGMNLAGNTAVKAGADTKYDAIADNGYKAVLKILDMKETLIKTKEPETQEKLAVDALKFLDSAAPFLVWGQHLKLDGSKGNVAMLFNHIEDMLAREKVPDLARPMNTFKNGEVVSDFSAAYLAKTAAGKKEKRVVDEDKIPDMEDHSTEAKATRRKNWGRQRSFA